MCARNAATLPEGILDAELFGNVRNYPNAGTPERRGLVGEANGTSLFLDEFGELPVSAQTHLLRTLDSGEYHRLGDARALRSDFRLIAATNRPRSVLRDDALGRMAFQIEVPGLDERREDIPLLVRHLLATMVDADPTLSARFSGRPTPSLALMRELLVRSYTGHTRELTSLLWRALERARSNVLEPASDGVDVPGAAVPGAGGTEGDGVDGEPRVDPSAHAIQRSLDENNGSIERTWRALGLSSRFALGRLIRKHRLELRKRPG
jgi:DNA-binding NtrC family response regulator